MMRSPMTPKSRYRYSTKKVQLVLIKHYRLTSLCKHARVFPLKKM